MLDPSNNDVHLVIASLIIATIVSTLLLMFAPKVTDREYAFNNCMSESAQLKSDQISAHEIIKACQNYADSISSGTDKND